MTDPSISRDGWFNIAYHPDSCLFDAMGHVPDHPHVGKACEALSQSRHR